MYNSIENIVVLNNLLHFVAVHIFHSYTYDAGGERDLKLIGSVQNVYSPAGAILQIVPTKNKKYIR